jgi:hypothetical protein
MRVSRARIAVAALGVQLLVVDLRSGAALAQSTAAEERIAVIVGANVGAHDDEPLRFAEADAVRFRDLVVELGGVKPERALLVLGGGPDQVLHALIDARARAQEIGAVGHRVVLLFYYSGHGDDESLHLPRGVLALADLRRELASVPADLEVSILDSCRGGAGRAKGVHGGPAFALAVAPESPRGSVELRASSLGEAAQESEELAGAVFTHFVVSGLRGIADTDGDGRVTLAELYAYAYRRTLMRTGTGAAPQHPDVAWQTGGAGEIVITRPAAAAAALDVPGGADRYLVFALPSAAVVGELGGERATRFALPAGRFLVSRRVGDSTGIATVDLSWGGRRELRDRDFRPIAREELVARGGLIELRPWRIEPRVGLEISPGSAADPALRVGAALAHARGAVEVELEVAYVGGGVSTRGFGGSGRAVTAGPSVSWRAFLGRVTAAFAVGAELRYSWQHLVRTEAGRAEAAGIMAVEDRASAAAGPKIGLSLAVPLGGHVTAALAASVAGLAQRQIGAADDNAAVTLQAVVSCTLGARYAF